MERRLSNLKSGILKEDVTKLASEWVLKQKSYDLDPRIVKIEATEIAKRWVYSHEPEMGLMAKKRKDGVT